ncbi:polysaccharide pyruvyl transferase family protein [Eubacterium maltosivorans]|uniref:Polysaccharide pyruvyl transferase n=1 Tax=Eubacterium maltosivorans TaxID=2041044 RepID=A0A4P9C6I0_EUBML|nr:polysaccharide pyruvyl transferase family protein [Eubacterium maltosivorans]QCT70195.1 polysaccharide pyruvyl transferase [Eubacterium maltosivorans]
MKIKNNIYSMCELISKKKSARSLNFDTANSFVVLIGSPEHGNLGDHAISVAECLFFNDYFANKNVIEISGDVYRSNIKYIKKQIKSNDILFITGGGFLGSLWLNEEEMVRQIIKDFPKNKIFILPQTIFFEDTEDGRNQFKISKSVYRSHDALYVFARDRNSYDFFCKEIFENNEKCFYVPDIVTYLDLEVPNTPRENRILMCLRKDKERCIQQEDKEELYKKIRQFSFEMKQIDTVVPRSVSIKQRDKELENIFSEFQSSKLVITDRLHGMLFAAITGTPCIAFNNSSKKVEGVYEWIKYLDYVKCVQTIEEAMETMPKLLEKDNCQYSSKPLQKKFDEMADIIKEFSRIL